ncbi:hypothetical protein ACIBG7_17320 [Nonomuraea sp. NPDC050328]|uniref:hypothetical protein n=1 Tax=Nonomuraea sp. NPDC050328 TaxID=3364361 RepID=UPI00379551B6
MPLLSAEWFATVAGAWGTDQVFRLSAAALVLCVTWRPELGLTWRRITALLADYLVVSVALDSMWSLADPDGRTLHERLSGTEVRARRAG